MAANQKSICAAMRSEREIIETVLDEARRDGSVRAVVRTNLLPKREYLDAYEFCFVVSDPEKYDGDVFRQCFGDRILLFRGDRNYPEMFPGTKAHLMVFRDGVTIVIHAMGVETFLTRVDGKNAHADARVGDTYQKLLDKDGILPEIERLEEKQTVFEEVPSREEFGGIHDEFWWVMKTFAEYAMREELLPAMFYLHHSVRGLLNRMLRWYIFLKAGRPVDMGILDSRMAEALDQDLYRLYEKTYPNAEDAEIWEAYESAAELWRRTGLYVSERCGYPYPAGTERDMTEFIRRLREQKQRDRSLE